MVRFSPNFPVMNFPSLFNGPLPDRKRRLSTFTAFTKLATGAAGLGKSMPSSFNFASGSKTSFASELEGDSF